MRLKVDIIVATGGTADPGGQECDQDDSHRYGGPRADPVEAGLVESLARPGGNVTGITNLSRELGGKRLELLKEAVPKLARVAVLYDPSLPGHCTRGERSSPSRGACAEVDYSALGGTSCGRFREGIRCAKQAAPGWTLRAGGPLMNTNQKRIAGLALKSRLPSMYSNREAVDAGGLMSYGADQADSYRRVAYYVDRILKGAKPADLPVEQPMKFEFVINLKTAKQIGVTIPPEVLARASRIIK